MTRALRLALVVSVCVAPACRDEAPPAPGAASVTARALLVRASLDLRGVRPREADYTRVDEDPAALDALIDEFLHDERFGARLRELFAPVYRTRIDFYPVAAESYGLEDEATFHVAVGDEPLRLLSHVAEHDLPWTDVVTADYTMANEVLGRAFPVDYPAGATGWRPVHYTDGRPVSGVLSTNALYWRYPSDGVNYNRGRANALSRILLCHDYLSRPVDFPRDIDLTDTEKVADAVRSETGCVSCHVSLDPLASYLFGFQYAGYSAAEMTRYHPERERSWQVTTGTAPGFFGRPGHTLRDLGQQMAADPRFVECTVRRVYEALLARPADLDDTDALTHHREVFLAGGLKLRALVRSVLADPRYRGAVSDEAGGVTRKLVTPELLASQIEDLTGYRLTSSGFDLMSTDAIGLRSLAGGVDGYSGSTPARMPNTTMVLVQQRLAEAAAAHAVEMGSLITPGDDEQEVAAAVQTLHRRLFGTRVAADGPEVGAALALWRDLEVAEGDARAAWTGVLSVLLRDPEFVLY
jgi:hypothetical protein